MNEVLRTDDWITRTVDTLVRDLIGMLNNPRSEFKRYEILYLKRDDGIHIKYPGPDGQEVDVKMY